MTAKEYSKRYDLAMNYKKVSELAEPRAVKPGLGCSVAGYNFREDLLRMYGNAVVEQTAEVAWIELWKKIL